MSKQIEIDKVINIAEKMFFQAGASNFCGCYEGDIGGQYEESIERFLKELQIKLEEENK